MKRCNNENDPYFKHYGGRGITVSEEWITSNNLKKICMKVTSNIVSYMEMKILA